MREDILDFLFKYRTIDEIKETFGITDASSFVKLVKLLNELEEEGSVYFNEKKGYINAKKAGIHIGRVIKKPGKDYAFIRTSEQDFYVEEVYLKDALDGDTVQIHELMPAFANSNISATAEVIKIIKRARLVGRLVKRDKEYYLDYPISSVVTNVKSEYLDKIVACDVIRSFTVKTRAGSRTRYELKVVDIICDVKDKRSDVETFIYQYGFSNNFPKEVLDYALKIKDVDDLASRTDLTNELIVTIDGDDAKDLDDAVSVTKVGEDYLLKVSIADVSHYVKEGSILDQEAYKRATSVYLADRVLPMLPERLSNDLCSLNPDTIKKTITCEMLISPKAKIKRHKIYPSFIKTKARLSYSMVNKLYQGEHSFGEDLDKMLFELKDLMEILKANRDLRGSLDFETIEPKIILNEDNEVLSIEVRERGIAERVIEECMLVANETVALHMYFLELPFIYRIHDKPDYERLEEVIKLIKNVDFKGSLTNQKHLQSYIERLKEDEESAIYNSLILRTMAKAKYSTTPSMHYGLAAAHYTHFTSPIRRYPDLIVHRLLRELVFNYDEDKISHFEGILDDIALHTSQKEKDSIDIERDVDKLFMCKYLAHNKETFTGVITSITNFGLFVTLENGIEGLVHVSNLPGYYEFDERRMALVGPKVYTLGDKVLVKVYNIIPSELKIDFTIVKRLNDEK